MWFVCARTPNPGSKPPKTRTNAHAPLHQGEPSWESVTIKKKLLQADAFDKTVPSAVLMRCWLLKKATGSPQLLGDFVTTLDALEKGTGKTFELQVAGQCTGYMHFASVKRAGAPPAQGQGPGQADGGMEMGRRHSVI